ncbi:hypothetical protein [Deinococcus navajonensis]|uniref:Uncharacterized protein n=1 Tax=Deinococcus navajonensis TaxID=309884 RepID=A0ABV8XHT8_9DEIO
MEDLETMRQAALRAVAGAQAFVRNIGREDRLPETEALWMQYLEAPQQIDPLREVRDAARALSSSLLN